MYKKEFTFEIEKHIAALSQRDSKGMQMEFNLVSFNGNKAKWDIRKWDENHEKMGKGIALTNGELDELATAIYNLGKDSDYDDDDDMSDSELFGNSGNYNDGLDSWTRNGMD